MGSLRNVLNFVAGFLFCLSANSCKLTAESLQNDASLKATSKPLVIAHRGLTSDAMPQNTLEALRESLETSVHGIEYDVRLTGDGRLVVTHDEDIKSTSDGSGPVHGMTLEELRKYNFGSKKGMANVRIPLFEEFFDLCAKHGKCQVIEIKDGAEYPKVKRLEEGKHVVDMLAEKIAKAGKENNVFVGCFTIRILLYAHDRYPRLPTCLFIGERNKNKYFSDGHVRVKEGSKAEECLKSVKMVGVMSSELTQITVAEFHDMGLLVNAWGKKIDREEYLRLVGIGVDYITSERLFNER